MGDDKNKGSLVSVSGVLIILVALGVTIFTQPFKGDRPSVSEVSESYKKINARLWQDPFRAVLDGVKDKEMFPVAGRFDIEDSAGKENVQYINFKYLKRIKREEVTVLGVMVPGGPYIDDTEMRLRLRYATLSGLGRIGFTPEDQAHIEYIKTDYSEKVTLSNIMPFEWLTNKNNSVLLLWINDAFQTTPLLKLARLAEYLKLAQNVGQCKVKFKIIGPSQSSTLKAMIEEVSDKNVSDNLKGLEIYSAMATVDDELLLRYSKKCQESFESDSCKNIKSLFADKNINFVRTIGSDGALATKLAEELQIRKITLRDKKTYFGNEKAHFLLVSEWDTPYGRLFENVFKEALTRVFKDDIVENQKVDQLVHRISYMRGIDGILPGEKGKKEELDKGDGKAGDKSDPLKNVKNLEQPVGKSQYDYLRRLAEAAYRLDQDIKACKQGEIKAIGVVGTDFYDKYLVLQALRQRFPDAIYFTTDLDARYVHPDHFQWTRNLIVASNFGLSLRKDLSVDIQGESPPFRDNYQTSVFLTVLRAFGTYLSQTDNDKKVRELIEKPLEPLIFEIGRHDADLLTDTGNTIHPGKHQYRGYLKLSCTIVIIIVCIFIFLFFASARVNNFMKELFHGNWKYRAMAGGGALFIIFVTLYTFQISSLPKEEPFSICEGISVWPTVLLRLLAIFLSVIFLYLSGKNSKKNIDFITNEFGYRQMADKDPKTTRCKAARNWMKNIANLNWVPENKTLADFWFKYVYCASDQYHIWRTIIIAVIYFLICGLIIRFDPPGAPVRGVITFWTSKVLVFFSVISFVALISYVLDVTRCCRRFIDIASEEFSRKLVVLSDGAIQEQIKNQGDLIRLIAMRTEAVGKLIFYPFIVWLVMFASRFDYFDNWVTPPGLAVVISLGAVYAWLCAFLLRRSAERARTKVIECMKNLLFESYHGPQPNKDLIGRIEFTIEGVRDMKQGAFAPFMQHPVVQSLLVPFGGVGGIYIVDFFTKMNF